MKTRNDRTGEVIGRLTILGVAPDRYDKRGKPRKYWRCQCECGSIKEIRDDGLNGRHTLSCGCMQRERVSEVNKGRTDGLKYGDSRERIHNIWYLIKSRCEEPSSPNFHNYGGRGIHLCDEWSNGIEGYFRFKEWSLNNGYSENLTIDRIDNSGNYSPENCRWVDTYVQGNNKRNNVFIEYCGKTQTLSQWARNLGVPMKSLYNRIQVLGWDIERAFNQPYRKSNRNNIVEHSC